MISEEEIMSKRTAKGGWTKRQLAEWGVPWPPPNGWKDELLAEAGNRKLDEQCDDARDRDRWKK